VLGVSLAFQDAVRRSHTAMCEMDVIGPNGQVIMTIPVHDGSVTADRTAGQMRRFTAMIADPDGTLTPATMADALAPFGNSVQLWRGVRIENIQTVSDLDNDVASWADGTNNGTSTDPATGELILGWV